MASRRSWTAFSRNIDRTLCRALDQATRGLQMNQLTLRTFRTCDNIPIFDRIICPTALAYGPKVQIMRKVKVDISSGASDAKFGHLQVNLTISQSRGN